MKPNLSLLVPMILLGMSCKKDSTIVPTATTNTTKEVMIPETAPASGTAARPGTPAIKGNWRLRLTGGGIGGWAPMPVTYMRRLRLHADLTYSVFNGISTSTGTYTLSTVSWPYPPGYRSLITFVPTPTAPPPGTYIFSPPPVYQYRFTADTLSIVPVAGADMIYEVYVRE
jgi:hypothetical protein